MERKGFSLIELLVALVVGIILIVGITYALVANLKYSKLNEARQEALYKGEKLLNYLVAKGFSDSCLQEGTYSCGSAPPDCCGSLAGDSSVSYQVVNVGSDIKKVKVTVSFEAMGETKTIELEKLKGDW